VALSMVHLLCAHRWAQGKSEYEDCGEFYLGAISPDAVHVRDHDDKSNKNFVHLNNWLSPDFESVQAYLQKHHSSFDAGYALHVLTDCQWVPIYRAECPDLFAEDGKLNIPLYYHDTYVADFELLRRHEALKKILRLIKNADAPENHPLLQREHFLSWRDGIIDQYEKNCPFDGEARAVTVEFIESFVDRAMPVIERELRRFAK